MDQWIFVASHIPYVFISAYILLEFRRIRKLGLKSVIS
jgi:hypothetical protein